MAIPTGEQWLRLSDLIKERKLSSVGLQEAMDRAREMELSGLYKQMAQTVWALCRDQRYRKVWQVAEVALITHEPMGMHSVLDECGATRCTSWNCFDELMKAYLTLMDGLSDVATGTACADVRDRAARAARELLVERGGQTSWGAFSWWRQLYEVLRNEGDYQWMIVASKALSDNAERVAAYGILEKVNPDVDRYGSWIELALAILQSMPWDDERYFASAQLATMVHDMKCFEEFRLVSDKFHHVLGVPGLTARRLDLLYGEDVRATDFASAIYSGMCIDSEEMQAAVLGVVDALLAKNNVLTVSEIADYLPESKVQRIVFARLVRHCVGRGEFEQARSYARYIKPEDQLLQFELLCAEAKADKPKKKNFETLRKYVETMNTGYRDGLIMVADTTGEPRDIAYAFDSIDKSQNFPGARIEMTLSLIRIAKRELARLTVK